jgi:hypothetical protein
MGSNIWEAPLENRIIGDNLFGGCPLCKECKVERSLCKQPERARPAPEAMAVDFYMTVGNIGYYETNRQYRGLLAHPHRAILDFTPLGLSWQLRVI